MLQTCHGHHIEAAEQQWLAINRPQAIAGQAREGSQPAVPKTPVHRLTQSLQSLGPRPLLTGGRRCVCRGLADRCRPLAHTLKPYTTNKPPDAQVYNTFNSSRLERHTSSR